jgi:phosphoglucosamine mutase
MSKLFGTDGIRGIPGEPPLDAKTIKCIGYAVAEYLYKKYGNTRLLKIILSRDTRTSGKFIFSNLVLGIKSFKRDIEIVDIGIFSTPGTSYIVKKYGALGGIVVSASHNPAKFNGIKVFSPSGTKLPDVGEKIIEERIHEAKIVPRSSSSRKGRITCLDIQAKEEYKRYILSIVDNIDFLRGKRIVVDCANGANYKIAKEIFDTLCNEVKYIGISPNGENINFNCGCLSLGNIKRRVKEYRADLGLSFDGDGDRVVFIDEKCNLVDGDGIVYLLGIHLKKKGLLVPQKVVLTEVSNYGVIETLRKSGIDTVIASVGDKNVYNAMVRYNIKLGGEKAGHVIIKPFGVTGDGLITAMNVFNAYYWLSNGKGLAFSSLFKKLNLYFQKNFNIEIMDDENGSRRKRIKQAIEKALTCRFSNLRFVVRLSGTEPLLRVLLESKNRDLVDGCYKFLRRLIKTYVLEREVGE